MSQGLALSEIDPALVVGAQCLAVVVVCVFFTDLWVCNESLSWEKNRNVKAKVFISHVE